MLVMKISKLTADRGRYHSLYDHDRWLEEEAIYDFIDANVWALDDHI